MAPFPQGKGNDRILREFPGRTEADLYLWIAEHRWFLGEAHGEVPLEQAAVGFASGYSRRPIRRAVRVLRRIVSSRADRKAA